MKKFIITLALFLMTTTAVQAAELIMFSMASCGYCQKFLKEVAPTYADSDAAKLLPLRIISMDRKDAPKWFDQAYDKGKIDGIIGTPTFIVFDSGEEKARLIGYQGKDRFYDDIGRFIESNKAHLEKSAGKSPIPFEKETEMLPKQALEESSEESGTQTNRSEGSRSKEFTPFVPFQPDIITPPKYEGESKNPHTGKLQKFPNGVFKSRDILDHQYKTETEAQIAANFLGCIGVHEHMIDGKKIYMPCSMQGK